MNYIKVARPTTSYSKQPRPTSIKSARYGIGVFGQARFGISDGFTKQVRPSVPIYTKSARPA